MQMLEQNRVDVQEVTGVSAPIGAEVAFRAGHTMRALLEEGLGAQPVAEVVVLPRLAEPCAARGSAKQAKLSRKALIFRSLGVATLSWAHVLS
jgi:hypothetical protein